jgi:hypothetical protein
MALSFERDIRPMFRDTDVDTMQNYGLDLSFYTEVKNKAEAIYATLAEARKSDTDLLHVLNRPQR